MRASSKPEAKLSPSCGGRVTSRLLVQKRSTQEKTTPRLRALRTSLPARSAVGLRGLSTAHPVLTPNWPASLPATLRAFPPPGRRFRGAPGRATRILRVLFRRARPTAEREQSRGRATLRPCRGFSAFHRVRATMARCSTGVPCAAVRRGRQAAQRESTGMSTPFSQGRMPCRKARPRLTDLLGRMPNKRQAGWPYLFGYFLFGHAKRK